MSNYWQFLTKANSNAASAVCGFLFLNIFYFILISFGYFWFMFFLLTLEFWKGEWDSIWLNCFLMSYKWCCSSVSGMWVEMSWNSKEECWCKSEEKFLYYLSHLNLMLFCELSLLGVFNRLFLLNWYWFCNIHFM